MSKFPWVGFVLFLLAMALFTGCNNPRSITPKGGTNQYNEKSTKKDGDDDHDHGPGPHGGTIIELGKWHGEFTVNHKKQEATVYILGSDAKTAAPLQVEKLLLSIKSPQFQTELTAHPQEGDPAGKSSRFVARHEKFGTEQEFEGTVSGVINGKPYAGDFKEVEEPKDPKHEKK